MLMYYGLERPERQLRLNNRRVTSTTNVKRMTLIIRTKVFVLMKILFYLDEVGKLVAYIFN